MDGTNMIRAGLLIFIVFVMKVTSQKLDECKKSGDYLWKKSSPQKFFFCYRVGYAMGMECQDDRFMCKRPGKVFAPCMCIGEEVVYDECEERFMEMPNSYQASGKVMKEAATVEECQDYCLKTVHCLAFSYRANDGECLINLPKTDPSAVVQMAGVTYYKKKACALKFGYKHRDVHTGGENGLSSTTPRPRGSATDTGPRLTGDEAPQGKEVGDGYSGPFPFGDDTVTTPHTPRETTTTIPDSGCPYGLRKYENKSHRGGVLLKHITDIEACKNWCLNYGYCLGVDYDLVLHMCYYHKVIEDVAVSDAENVVHIRRQKCTPPLKCWSQISYNSSNVDPSTPQIPCQGVCFVKEKIFHTYSVFERGCHMSSPPHNVGCVVDGALTGLTCYCDTDRCNGLSIAAAASLMLHLPLDGDASDHSGLGRDGQAALGYMMPETSCLEKAINCSMVFNGQQCLEVTQMASQAWGDVNLQNEFTPMFTVSVWFKAADRDVAEVQGITGNSWDPAISPTWAIQTSNITSNVVTAGISTDSSLPFLPDFRYLVARSSEWHHLAMTYDSTFEPEEGSFPMLRVYLDGLEQPGNMQSDMNSILVRRQPVTVGCVMGKAFVGCIDDLRIFASALSKADIQALLQMNDGLYQ